MKFAVVCQTSFKKLLTFSNFLRKWCNICSKQFTFLKNVCECTKENKTVT